MAERGRLTEVDGPPHDSLLHLHEHPHSWLPGERWQHQHLHRHVYDMPALEPEET